MELEQQLEEANKKRLPEHELEILRKNVERLRKM